MRARRAMDKFFMFFILPNDKALAKGCIKT
jgi:hypothetical protein